MKIEKIRFRNLASLAGEWEIDLTETLFADAGIFALSGPVGSGKSTVFDAVRLALYGRTARLDRVNQNDNEIMTRGETECFAEVVFSNDSGRFLCRWSQHRAVRTGKLQKAQHLLSELGTGDGEGRILSSKLEETRDRIRSLTGMDFSHFSRAMILPQGQFADFLRASPDERSPLLEQITGTGIYAEISRKVHEFTRARNLEREALEQSCAGIEILSDERLQELQNAIRTFRQSVQAISTRYDAASEILRTRNALQQESATLSTLETTLAGQKCELSRCEQRRAEAEQAKLHAESERTILVPLLRRVRELDTRLSLLEQNDFRAGAAHIDKSAGCGFAFEHGAAPAVERLFLAAEHLHAASGAAADFPERLFRVGNIAQRGRGEDRHIADAQHLEGALKFFQRAAGAVDSRRRKTSLLAVSGQPRHDLLAEKQMKPCPAPLVGCQAHRVRADINDGLFLFCHTKSVS